MEETYQRHLARRQQQQQQQQQQHHHSGPAPNPTHPHYGGGGGRQQQQQTFLPPAGGGGGGGPPDQFFRPPGGPGYQAPPDFPPNANTRPRGVGPPPPSTFANWSNSTFSGPPPPGFGHIPPPLNFPVPPDDRWNLRSPFLGGAGGSRGAPGGGPGGGDPHATFQGMFKLQMNSGSGHQNGSFGGGNFHQDPGMNHRHPQPGGVGNGGGFVGQPRGAENFALMNGLDGFQGKFGQFGAAGGGDVFAQRVKRIKTASMGVPKHRTPKRPLVAINKELKMKHSAQLSIVSYNLLAQDLIEKNMHLYTHCSHQDLSWEFRKNNLLNDLAQSSADILCLQEVQGEHYHRWYQPQLSKQGYTGLYKRRTGSYSDGCAVFYKEAKLKLLEWKGLEYQRRVNVLNRDNVAVLAKFSLIEKGIDNKDAVFCLANTHLLYNPKAGEVKLAQLSYLLAELHKMASTPDSKELLPVLVCGDLNSTPNSPLVSFLTTSHLNYTHMSAPVIAGYSDGSRSRSRAIPIPLLPSHMNIGHNCVYTQQQRTSGGVTEVTSAVSATTEVRMGMHGSKSLGDMIGSENREEGRNEESCEGSVSLKTSVKFVVHSEFVSDMEVDENSPVRTARSVRGAKGKGHIGRTMSESVLGSTQGTKRGRGGQSSQDTGDMRMSASPGSSVEDNLGSEFRASGGSGTKEGEGGNLESSVTKQGSGNGDKMGKSAKKDSPSSGASAETPDALLSHPFKLLPAYPISKSPSTITTYHQCAFETVDYIFFSPVACRGSGAGGTGQQWGAGGKKQLAGFNLLKRRVLPSTHTLLDLGPQPHQFLSSDHLLLQATFQLVW